MPDHHKLMALKQGHSRKSRIMSKTAGTTRKVRIICNDPYATDSSDDEEERVKKIVHEICFSIGNPTRSLKSYKFQSSIQDSNNDEKTPKKRVLISSNERKFSPVTGKYRGVCHRKSGKWVAQIFDPFQHKRVWLGTYNTAEESSNAYELKRLKFKALTNSIDSLSKKHQDEAFVCVSEDLSVSVSEKSSGSVAEHKTIELGIMDKELMALEQIGGEMDVDLALESFIVGDGVISADDFVTGFEDLPICGFEDTGQASLLMDLDFDFDFEAGSEVLAWMDDTPSLINGAPLNIACP